MIRWTNKQWGALIGALVMFSIALVGFQGTALVVLFGVLGYFVGKFMIPVHEGGAEGDPSRCARGGGTRKDGAPVFEYRGRAHECRRRVFRTPACLGAGHR